MSKHGSLKDSEEVKMEMELEKEEETQCMAVEIKNQPNKNNKFMRGIEKYSDEFPIRPIPPLPPPKPTEGQPDYDLGQPTGENVREEEYPEDTNTQQILPNLILEEWEKEEEEENARLMGEEQAILEQGRGIYRPQPHPRNRNDRSVWEKKIGK